MCPRARTGVDLDASCIFLEGHCPSGNFWGDDRLLPRVPMPLRYRFHENPAMDVAEKFFNLVKVY